jgi:hypothetical protein
VVKTARVGSWEASSRLWLLSDGRLAQTDWSGCGKGITDLGFEFVVPNLPAGVVWADFSNSGCTGWLLRSDGVLSEFLNPGPVTASIPYPEAGVKYVKILAGIPGEVTMLLRSDGRVTITPGVDLCEQRKSTPTQCQTYVYTTERSDYVGGVRTSRYALLLRGDGQVDRWRLPVLDLENGDHGECPGSPRWYQDGPWCEREHPWVPAGSVPPPLPDGLKYTQISSDGYVTAFIRSDGQAFAKGVWPMGRTMKAPKVPTLPAGVKYVHAEVVDAQVVLLRTDGQIAIARTDVYNDAVWNEKTQAVEDRVVLKPLAKPSIPQGWVFTGLAESTGGSVLVLAANFGIAKIPDDATVGTVIAKVTPSAAVAKGKPVTVKVTVSSRAATKGGVVRITKGSTVLGKAKVNAKGVATIKVSTNRFKARGANPINVKFLGIGQAAPSRSVKATITTRR